MSSERVAAEETWKGTMYHYREALAVCAYVDALPRPLRRSEETRSASAHEWIARIRSMLDRAGAMSAGCRV